MASILVIMGLYCISSVMAADGWTRSPNATNSTNDMYVIHATVYQVGIITNKSDEEIANLTGNQEALTFYHSNGSTVDLGAISAPLLTNVTAQSVVGVAPVTGQSSPWAVLKPMTSTTPTIKRSVSGHTKSEHSEEEQRSESDLPYLAQFKRSLENRTDGGPPIKVVKETALIPPEAGLRSIGLPSLVGLNTSFAAVPVPIPNTSIVRYAKVNTVVQSL